MRITSVASGLVAAMALGGCSAQVSEADLKEQARIATAEALEMDPAVAAIEIEAVDRGATSSSWLAHYDGRILTCSGNERFQLPDCRVAEATASN